MHAGCGVMCTLHWYSQFTCTWPTPTCIQWCQRESLLLCNQVAGTPPPHVWWSSRWGALSAASNCCQWISLHSLQCHLLSQPMSHCLQLHLQNAMTHSAVHASDVQGLYVLPTYIMAIHIYAYLTTCTRMLPRMYNIPTNVLLCIHRYVHNAHVIPCALCDFLIIHDHTRHACWWSKHTDDFKA